MLWKDNERINWLVRDMDVDRVLVLGHILQLGSVFPHLFGILRGGVIIGAFFLAVIWINGFEGTCIDDCVF